MDTLFDTMFKVDEGVAITVLFAAMTPLLAAPAERILNRRDTSRDRAAMQASATGDDSNNAAVNQVGDGNVSIIDQTHTSTTVTIHHPIEQSSNADPVSTTVGIGVVALLTLVAATVAFLKIGASIMMVGSATALGVTTGTVIHLLLRRARPATILLGVGYVVAAGELFVGSQRMETFTFRRASLTTAGGKVNDWKVFEAWERLRPAEQTLGMVFMLGTAIGVLAVLAVTVGSVALILRCRYDQRRPFLPASHREPKWRDRIRRFGAGWLVVAVVVSAGSTVLNTGILIDDIHLNLHPPKEHPVVDRTP